MEERRSRRPDGDESPARPGQMIRDYEILAEIGHGGMGVVYRARDRRLGRTVALKCPWPHLASDARIRARFLKEARATSRLTHPGIVQIYEAFEADDLPWIALQFVEGRDLRTVLAAGQPPVEDALRWGEEIASALEAAHARNVLHRDVSPRNVLISREGRALLADFGLARMLVPPEDVSALSTAADSGTAPGTVLGAPHYMSPEQALGREIDERSDLFSLGSVLYEVLTGRQAFPGRGFGEILDRVVHQDPDRPSQIMPDGVPLELERIVMKCLKKSRDDRYPDARALRTALRALRRAREFEEYSQTRGLVPAPTRRTRIGRAFVAVAALAALGAAGVYAWRVAQSRAAPPFPEGTPRQVTTGDAWDRDPCLSPDGSRIAFASDRTGDFEIYVVDANGGQALQLTDYAGPDSEPAWYPDGSAIAYTTRRDGRDFIRRIGQVGGGEAPILADARSPAVSPDGTRIAFARSGPGGFDRIGVASLEDPSDALLLTADGEGQFHHRDPAWSPDGQSIAYRGFERIWVVPAEGGTPRALTDAGCHGIAPVWAPSGRSIVFESVRDGIGALWWVAADGGVPRRFSLGAAHEGHPSFSRDGRRFAYSTLRKGGEIVLLDRVRRAETVIADSQDDAMPTLAPDGSAVVFVSKRWGRTAEIWHQPLEDGRPDGEPRRLTDRVGAASHPVLSSDGQWIAFYRIQGETRDLWVLDTAGGEARRLTDHPASEIHPAWSPGGEQIAFVSDREGGFQIWILPVAEGRASGPPRRVTHDAVKPLAPVWSPDGSRLAFIGSYQGRSEVWTVPADGTGAPQPMTSGAGALRVRWEGATNRWWVCGTWGRDLLECRVLDPENGEPAADSHSVVLGDVSGGPVFDVTAGGSLVAFSRAKPRGHVWAIAASR